MAIAENIKQLCQQVNRQNVLILAVSKTQSIEQILEAYHAGIQDFGENYLQEAQPKIQKLQDYPITWHYIGHIQSNKCKKIAHLFDWVHTLDRFDIARQLNSFCQNTQKTLNICIQVNLFDEPQKSGVSCSNLNELVQTIQNFSHLRLRGLMTILPASLTSHEEFEAFKKLAELKQQINQIHHISMDTLSMGMSGDYLYAIQAGSTIIRLGQAIFGARRKP
jgi:pyridoxal phosphate enzyme (YggS family)